MDSVERWVSKYWKRGSVYQAAGTYTSGTERFFRIAGHKFSMGAAQHHATKEEALLAAIRAADAELDTLVAQTAKIVKTRERLVADLHSEHLK